MIDAGAAELPVDTPAFEILHAGTQVPLVLLCDHASNAIPIRLARLGLALEETTTHIAWDIGAAEVVRQLSARLRAVAILSGCSRLVVDCNRAPGDPAAMPAITGGVMVPGNRDLNEAEAEARRRDYFHPYHEAAAVQVARLASYGVPPLVVAIHSFTPNLCGDSRPWHVGVLWNRDPRLAVRFLGALRSDPGLCVGENQPYSAREIGYTLDRHAGAAGLPHLALEIRQDQLADSADRARWAGRIGDLLAGLLAEPSIHRVEFY
ncbi:MAG: N-formylglutamate amidohydrolase [Alphaproteobacteria bacterium]